MIRISPNTVKGVRAVASGPSLASYLQGALRLEHATIPPYLTAWFSIPNGTNVDVRNLLQGIVVDEMLHMAIVANIINAVGGHPVLNQAHFVPTYPSHLPMSIDPDLTVGLRKMSKDLVLKTFMSIEEPENPEEFPVKLAGLLPSEAPTFATVGQFYTAVVEKIEQLGDSVIVGDPALQFSDTVTFPPEEIFDIVDAASAIRALHVIIEQGEGGPKRPINADGDVAHYYRFQQIIKGRRLIPADNPQGYAFAGDKVELNQAEVINIVENSKAAMYAPGTPARQAVDAFNAKYSEMLRSLHATFNTPRPQNGAPYNDAYGAMVNLSSLARQIMSIEISDGVYAAPSFEYLPAA